MKKNKTYTKDLNKIIFYLLIPVPLCCILLFVIQLTGWLDIKTYSILGFTGGTMAINAIYLRKPYMFKVTIKNDRLKIHTVRIYGQESIHEIEISTIERIKNRARLKSLYGKLYIHANDTVWEFRTIGDARFLRELNNLKVERI